MTEPARRGPNLLVYLPVLVFALVAGIAATMLLSGKDVRQVPSAMIGKPVQAFDLPALPGLPGGLSRQDLVGRVTVVNFFASWCTPCLIEHPFLMRLARLPDVRLVGVNHKDKPEAAVGWLRKHGNPYARIGTDVAGRTAIDWGSSGVPETYVVDAKGVIRFQHIGPLTPQVIEEKLLPAIRAAARRDNG